ncbi:LPXTG cell wall anchor domain-containing protein [Glycomyces tritici]|uniref:LPXTG cell wall anchor domain-containing protein n=1 Tax=Glycomyces tritici TaxID=2665176 RepID=A0ABT7YPQ5_9ACTN|nr:LPXTG cell wall anchor domain-containing protein [Glycomyces tritici]MDN3240587.1 LPXTG cell wall anchor domain-containing protein [Glycomyces tritici]
MTLTRRQKRLGILGAAGLAGATALALGIPAFAGDHGGGGKDADTDSTVTLDLKDAHKGSEADDFETGCGEDDQIPGDKPADYDGWVFVLPSNAGDKFLSVTAVFEDEDGDEHTEQATVVTSGNSGSAKRAYVGVPTGWILVDAWAEVVNGDEEKHFNVTHTCPGEPGEEPTTDAPTSDAPTSDAPTSDAPTSDAPTSDAPTSDAPTSDAPTSDAPTSDAPTSDTPTSDAPTSDVPTSDAPTSDTPTSDAPTSEPEASTSPAESSPAESSPAASSPAESSSAAPSSEAPSSGSTPGQASTTPAGSSLPSTGASLTYALGAGVLLAAGIALLVAQRRRSENAEGA